MSNLRSVDPTTEAQVLRDFAWLRTQEMAGVPRGQIIQHAALSLADSGSSNKFIPAGTGNVNAPASGEVVGHIGPGLISILQNMAGPDLRMVAAHCASILAERGNLIPTAEMYERIAQRLRAMGGDAA